MNPLFGSHPVPLVVAHRGANRIAPENTLAALAAAMQSTRSLVGIEIDVQISADGHAVLYHDHCLDKAGRPGHPVESLGVEELTSLEVRGERIPTLRSVLARFLPSTRLLVELKMYGDLEADPLLRCRRTDVLLGELMELGELAAERLQVLSFDPQTLRLMHLQAPQLHYILNVGAQPRPPTRFSELTEEAHAGHLSGLCVEIEILEPDLVALARGAGLPVLTFTCNQPAQVDRALACGVDAILSDDPVWLARYLEAQPESGLPTAS